MNFAEMFSVSEKALDQIVPFSLVVRTDGTILHAGSTLRKILGLSAEAVPPGFFELFRITSPRMLRDKTDLTRACGKRIALEAASSFRPEPLALRASIAAMTPEQDLFLILTSLGAELHRLADELCLTNQDFPHADCSIDILYLLKTQTELLRDTQALAERLKAAKELAELQAETDILTGLANRRALGQFTENVLSQAPCADGACKGEAFLLHIDLDRFKQVNDTFGHAAGDAILKRVASDLRSVAGSTDIAARIGGDEFVLILTEQPDLQSVEALATQLITTISAPLEFHGQSLEVGASVGITRLRTQTDRTFGDFLLEADLALYDAKTSGRAAVRVFSGEMREQEAIVQELSKDIVPALERGEFVPFYQLQFDVRTNTPFGVEVLGRWLHLKHGMIVPSRFLYVSERARLTEKIDRAIYTQALDDFADWKAKGIAPPHISLNITARLLADETFLPWLKRVVSSRSICRGEVVIELVETILIDEESAIIVEAVEALDKAGFMIAIDDFGTGHASIASMISVPVKLVKIDKTFVTDIHENPKLALLTRTIIEMVNQLGLQALVEGVETAAQFRVVEEMGCSVFQGFYFGRPVSAVEFTEKLEDADWIKVLAENRLGIEPLKRA